MDMVTWLDELYEGQTSSNEGAWQGVCRGNGKLGSRASYMKSHIYFTDLLNAGGTLLSFKTKRKAIANFTYDDTLNNVGSEWLAVDTST